MAYRPKSNPKHPKKKELPTIRRTKKRNWWQSILFVVHRPLGLVTYLVISLFFNLLRVIDPKLYLHMAFAVARHSGLELTTRMRKRDPFKSLDQKTAETTKPPGILASVKGIFNKG